MPWRSDEKFRQPGGAFGLETEGGRRGEGGLYIGTEGRRLRPGLNGIYEGSNDGEVQLLACSPDGGRRRVTWPGR
jgi:hypothetical protein